jgi:hypothetical protein
MDYLKFSPLLQELDVNKNQRLILKQKKIKMKGERKIKNCFSNEAIKEYKKNRGNNKVNKIK